MIYKLNRQPVTFELASTSEPNMKSIREYQKGYDPVHVNWEKVLTEIQNGPGANQFVFNY